MPIPNSLSGQSILAYIPLEGEHYFSQANLVPIVHRSIVLEFAIGLYYGAQRED